MAKAKIGSSFRAACFARHGAYCHFCGASDTEALTVCHLLAENNGGALSLDNTLPGCWVCNVGITGKRNIENWVSVKPVSLSLAYSEALRKINQNRMAFRKFLNR